MCLIHVCAISYTYTRDCYFIMCGVCSKDFFWLVKRFICTPRAQPIIFHCVSIKHRVLKCSPAPCFLRLYRGAYCWCNIFVSTCSSVCEDVDDVCWFVILHLFCSQQKVLDMLVQVGAARNRKFASKSRKDS